MKPTVKKVYEEAQKLSIKQQRQLVERISNDLPLFEDPEIQAEWAEEIKRRIDEMDSGKVKTFTWEDIERDFANTRKRLKRAGNSPARKKRN